MTRMNANEEVKKIFVAIRAIRGRICEEYGKINMIPNNKFMSYVRLEVKFL